jgi:hypothetical protein
MDSFDQVLVLGAVPLRFSAFYPRRLQEPMGLKGKKISSFSLTKYAEVSLQNLEKDKLYAYF